MLYILVSGLRVNGPTIHNTTLANVLKLTRYCEMSSDETAFSINLPQI